MIIDKSKFNSKAELLAYVVSNKNEIINLKKSTTKFTDADSFGNVFAENVVKAISTNNTDDLEKGIIKRTIIGNTYNWLDSHDDVHIKGIFTKTLQENQKNILHLHDHEFKITSKVGTPLSVYEKQIAWKDLGVNKTGETTSLFMDSEINKMYNALIFNEYLTNKINQHSVGMQYVKMFMCANDATYKEEFANWNTYFPMVGNQDKAIENGYFFAQTEAKLKEISCVIQGSNELTPTIENKIESKKEDEPVIITTRKIDYDNLKKQLTFN